MFLLIPTLLVTGCNLILGFVTFKKNPHSWTNRLLLFLTIVVSFWAVSNYFSVTKSQPSEILFWIRIVMAAAGTMFPVIFLLCRAFPSRSTNLHPGVLASIAFFTLFIEVLSLTPFVFKDIEITRQTVTPIPGPAMPIFAINVLGFLLLSLITLYKKYRLSKGAEKTQLKFFILGITATFTLATVTNFIFVNLLKVTSLVAIGPLFSLILITSISYAIIRHKLLDISLVITRTVTYSLTVIAVASLYSIGLIITSNLFFDTRLSTLQQLTLVILTVFITLSFSNVRRLIELATDKLFFKNQYHSNEVLSSLSKIMASTLQLDNLTHNMLQILVKQMRITKAAFILLDNNRISSVKSEGFSTNPDLDEKEIRLLGETPNTLIFEDLDNGETKDVLRKLTLSVIVHLRSEGQQIGLLVLGEKESGDIYSQQDLQLLEIFAPEAAVAIQNSGSYEEIRRFNITLQEEIKKATSDLLTANEKLIQLDKIKDEFVYLASHELRTPMTAIKSYVWMVLNKKAGSIDPKTKQYLDIVYSSTERLIHMVNEMLDLSRIESGKTQLQKAPFSLPDLFTQLENEFQARVADRKLNLDVSCDSKITSINADRDKVLQILENLVGNSVKFTPAKGHITISAVPTGKSVSISVTDTGQGISEDDLPKLFAKFGRLDGSLTSLPESGTGLGLYLTKQYVELHGGQITVASKLGKGSTFTFTIPLV